MSNLSQSLTKHHQQVVLDFHKKHANTLKKAQKSVLHVATAGIMAAASALHAQNTITHLHQTSHKDQQNRLDKSLTDFFDKLPDLIKEKGILNVGEESIIAQALSKRFGMNLKVTLDGNRLNEILGYMGAEQHLYRWQGDTLANHDLQRSGIAPLQGAFKNFDNADQEKYYVAVQLHELPTWNKDWPILKPWYKYRKVFVYNPVQQKGVVAVIGDAGPSKWTGKTFGGSPEIMEHLNMVDGAAKGKAIILFIDDPENKIALGPVPTPQNLALK